MLLLQQESKTPLLACMHAFPAFSCSNDDDDDDDGSFVVVVAVQKREELLFFH